MVESKDEVNKIKSEINDLRKELNSINEEKLKWSVKKREIYNSISGIVNELREHKSKRNFLTKQVRDIKKARDKLNVEIKNKIDEIKRLNVTKRDYIKSHHLKEDPTSIKKEIDDLERKIETDALSFDKEKKMMKLIHEKQKLLGQAKGLMDVVDKGNSLSKEIDSLKKKAKEKHERIQKLAEKSQEHHEMMIKISEQLKNSNEKEKDSFDKIMEFQKRVDSINSELEKKLVLLKKITEKYFKGVKKKQEAKKKEIEEVLKKKEHNVEEKIKKGKKLTTEDFLIFQRQGM